MDHIIVLPSPTRVVSEENTKAVYEVDSLYPGYGHTLGNSIRRILLSSLTGAAITRVTIKDANHEFSTISGVHEDVVRILLNLKQLRFKLHGDGPEIAKLDIKGAREVTGKDVKCPSSLEVVNPDHHILTLTEKSAHIFMELTVERGIGFVPSEELAQGKVAVGTLVLDAIFTPIRRANYEVENMRVGDRTDYNRLRIIIETDGSISPREAFTSALSIMRHQIERIESFVAEGEEGKGKDLGVITNAKDELADFGFSRRTHNALLAAGIITKKELAQKSEEELRAIEGIGDKAVKEIKKAVL